MDLRIAAWYSMGRGDWRISFPGGGSLLQWDDIDSLMTLIECEISLTRNIHLSGSYGSGSIDDGKNTDSDFVTIGFVNANFIESEAQSDGETWLYDLTLNADIDYVAERFRVAEFAVFIGFFSYSDELHDRDGRITLFVLDQSLEGVEFPGLNNTYDFEWTGFRVGARTAMVINESFTLEASTALLLGLEYEGEAFWNLRTDFRSTPPNFVHEADGGTGIDAQISLDYQVFRALSVYLGYRTLGMSANGGTDTTYLADGSVIKSSLDDVESVRHGFLVGIRGKF
jgi:hypothetical protein